MMPTLTLRLAQRGDAPAMLAVIRRAFAARRAVDPPADALSDTVGDLEDAIHDGYAVCAELDGAVVGCLLIAIDLPVATLRRVSVAPEVTRQGIAGQLVGAACELAADLGCHRVELMTRQEFPEVLDRWLRQGFELARPTDNGFILSRELPVAVRIPSSARMHELGRRLADVVRAGDVIIANGELGAGKTTLAQGLGAGMRVDGAIISPTFVISRVHPNPSGGPELVHVDAYRMGDSAELADIDLDASLASSVTLIEWGAGKAEWLADERLEITIERSADPADETRTVYLTGIGSRWAGVLGWLRELP
ncbi:MAG: tRNA (adenosine(37)-N6)-threonylcarbamoyltransferase complex ATPase subunit type 1 TsaE [Arachnia sp.]